jgi:epoxyqueuosine reductase
MSSASEKNLSVLIKEKASDLGFDLCGIALSRSLIEREGILQKWCDAGMNAGMNYLERDTWKRINPETLVPGAKSLVVTGLSYFTAKKQKENGVPVLSRYVYGENYHDVITRKLDKLLVFINGIKPGTAGRIFVDSGPVMEKAWAVEAGLGWQGKHSVVINEKIGSFFFIGILVLPIELDYDRPYAGERCGDCSLCIELCPTGAINDNHTIDARKCISNLTIENRGQIPEDLLPEIGGRIYGCDRCQEVCPWNRDAKQHNHPEFDLPGEIENMTREDWLNLSEEDFLRLFKGTEIARKKYVPFMRNVTDVTK